MKAITNGNTTQSGGGLSPQEIALVNSYRNADDRARSLILRLADVNSTSYPRRNVPALEVARAETPRLRLVVGGAA